MGLEDFEPISTGAFERERTCTAEDCTEQGVVGNPYTGAFKPLCFRHAFVAALDEDEEAQKLALGWSVGHAFRDANIERRTG